MSIISGTVWRRMTKLVTVAVVSLAPVVPALADPVIGLSYQTDQNLTPGTIVSIDQKTGGVEPANINNIDYMYGVVVSGDQSLLSFSSPNGNQVQVATNGVAQVFVSDLNGDIKPGDAITASTIAGVGMKATNNVKVIGIAQQSLSGSSGKSKQTVTDASGQKREVQLGAIAAAVNISYFYKEASKTVVPTALQSLANSVAGKNVAPLPIIASLVIFVVALGSICALLYGAIRGTIISVGRNPMAQAAVYRNLLQVSVLIVCILGAAVASIYLILTRL